MAQAPTSSSPGGLVYHQSTGELTLDGRTIATGSSGSGPGMNNPEMEASQGQGPIPKGVYTMVQQFHSSATGPGTIRITPNAGTQTYGRKDFEMHGDGIAHRGSASEGCIIMPPDVCRQVASRADRTLTVTR